MFPYTTYDAKIDPDTGHCKRHVRAGRIFLETLLLVML